MKEASKIADLLNDPRVTARRKGDPDGEGECVVYWMQRSQRGVDNAALDVAVRVGNLLGKPVVVFFAPVPFYPNANLRHYHFLNQGIPDIANDLEKRNIGFVLDRYPHHSLIEFCEKVKPALVVGDENPLRETEKWRTAAAKKLRAPLWTVDSDVVVPSKLLEKAQYAARVIRPRLQAHFKNFLVESKNPHAKKRWIKPRSVESLSPDVEITKGWSELDRSLNPVSTFKGGSREAARLLKRFVKDVLPKYSELRRKAELDGTSRLSPYLHFGHISPITVALAVKDAHAPTIEKAAFLNELITWRELAINFVRFQPDKYDSFESGENWAHRTLAEHVHDKRPIHYTEKQMENAETYDDLWNAAQRQMVDDGWMHNMLRMYWAKKILEWSPTPQKAYATALKFNDRYFLDGRDPNGYAGVAWSIVGKFDRPWFDRPIFGKIRYMAQGSTGKKFDSKKYIAQHGGPAVQDQMTLL